ncbi:vesicle-associated membrane protein [Acrasis kona]|uniref:Vesicle-associated membrane protein n=1 Tax=Acrasis kona TaxID=1008807 RepID=A0AAW2Z2Q2_9EUKA
MPIVFSLIADSENNNLGAHPANNKVMTDTIIAKILPKLPQDNHKRTLTQKDGNYVYFCVAEGGYSKRICWAFIDDLETKFLQMRSPSQGQVKKLIKDRVVFFNDPANDKIIKLQNKMDDLKGVMVDNFDKILDRGDKLEMLQQSTDDIVDGSIEFRRNTGKVKRNMCCNYIILVLVLIFIILAIIVIAVLAGCGFPTFHRCRSSN